MIIGIDPGIKGAVAILKDDLSYYDVFDMPTMPLSKTKQQINPWELTKRLIVLDPITKVCIERVSAMPEQGVSSMFNFGVCYGIVRGVCAGLMLPVILITPQEWKKKYSLVGKDKPKDLARTVAQQLYPDAPLPLMKHVGRADALLIARYGGSI
jgi:crossover junction endodeoxyribonuclease RuvC